MLLGASPGLVAPVLLLATPLVEPLLRLATFIAPPAARYALLVALADAGGFFVSA